MTEARTVVRGRLVIDDAVVPGRVIVEDGVIVEVRTGETVETSETDEAEETADGRDDAAKRGEAAATTATSLPIIAPGFVDVHVHGWGGHSAMGGRAALDGMARALLPHGVTSFLPTAVTAPIDALATFAESVRTWSEAAPTDGADPLGFNLEGPFLAPSRKGAHEATYLRTPQDVGSTVLHRLASGLRLITIAPELPGAIELIRSLRERGIAIALGHSAATLAEAAAGYAAGATSTTHLFNAMSGVDHRGPGLAVAALLDDEVHVELIADRVHVATGIWPLITRLKPTNRLILVSDAIPLAGSGPGRGRLGDLEVDVLDDRATLAGTTTLAGSVIALDTAVRNLVESGVGLPAAVAAATTNPLALLGVTDRGRIAAGQRADLVELDDDLRVRRVMRAGTWFAGAAGAGGRATASASAAAAGS